MEAGGFVSAPVHATVSGKVIAVEPRLHPNGSKVMSIVIENDGEDRLHESVHPYDFAAMSNDERIETIRSAGMVRTWWCDVPHPCENQGRNWLR